MWLFLILFYIVCIVSLVNAVFGFEKFKGAFVNLWFSLTSIILALVALLRTMPKRKRTKCECGHGRSFHGIDPPFPCTHNIFKIDGVTIKESRKCFCQRYSGPKDDFMLMKEMDEIGK